jgi:hypothetical protein
MTIGFVVTKQQLDGEMGANALALRHDFRIALEKRHFLLITSDVQLKALGYSDGTGTNPINEIAIVKSAYADLEAAYNAMVAANQWLNVDQLAGTIQT